MVGRNTCIAGVGANKGHTVAAVEQVQWHVAGLEGMCGRRLQTAKERNQRRTAVERRNPLLPGLDIAIFVGVGIQALE